MIHRTTVHNQVLTNLIFKITKQQPEGKKKIFEQKKKFCPLSPIVSLITLFYGTHFWRYGHLRADERKFLKEKF